MPEAANRGDRVKRAMAREYQILAEGALTAVDYYERLLERYPDNELHEREARLFSTAKRDAAEFAQRARHLGGLVPALSEDAKSRNQQLVANYGWASVYTGERAFVPLIRQEELTDV